MQRQLEFFRTTVVGGFFVVLPIVLVVFLLSGVVDTLGALIDPLAASLPVKNLGGVEVALLLSIGAVVLLCFLAGWVVRTGPGERLVGWLERTLLEWLPGYTLLRNLTRRFSGEEGTVAIARLGGGDVWALVFVAEALEDGRYAVFLPYAPTPTIGPIYIVGGDDLQILDVSMGKAVNAVMQWGIGTKDLLPRA